MALSHRIKVDITGLNEKDLKKMDLRVTSNESAVLEPKSLAIRKTVGEVFSFVLSTGATVVTRLPQASYAVLLEPVAQFFGNVNDLLKGAPSFLLGYMCNRATAGFNTGSAELSKLKVVGVHAVAAVASVGLAVGADAYFEWSGSYHKDEQLHHWQKALVGYGANTFVRLMEACVVNCVWKKDQPDISVNLLRRHSVFATSQSDLRVPMLSEADLERGNRFKSLK